MTAHWLKQMGIGRVFVLHGGIGQLGLIKSRAESQTPSAFTPPRLPALNPRELQAMLNEKEPPLLINVGQSTRHKAGHVPGAVWAIRAYLEKVRQALPKARRIVVTSDSGRLAPFAAHDAAELWPGADIYILDGGNDAWASAGLPLDVGLDCVYSPPDDVWYKPYEDIKANRESMQEYFSWEARLVEDTKADGCVTFKLGPV